MKKYRLLISHVGDDKDIALKCVERFKSDFENEQFALIPIYMENPLEPCVGDFGIWSENAVKSADGVLAIITDNTAVQKTVNGIVANIKIVYDEISLAKSKHKDLIILRQDGAALAEGYDLLLQRAKSVYFDKDNDLNEKLTEVVNEIISHAKHRFAGNPLLEYAGHETVTLIPSVKTDVSSYLGRSKELQRIDDCFNDGKRIVCLTGFGGIGKTTLAKMYAKHATEPVSIVYCSSEEMSLRDAVIGLRVEFDSPEFTQMTVEEKYNLRISQLKNLSNHVIVIFDNFNADFGLKNNVKVLEDLTVLEKCKFIISSRCKLSRSDVGIIEVDKLNDDELLTLFYRDSHLPKTADNDSLINKLIETTKGHTMTMELAAKAVGIDENGIDLQEVVDGILSVDALTRVEDRADGYDEYQTIYAHLRTLFGLSQINEGQKLLLGCLSFVAKHGLSVKELKECVEYKTEDLLRLVGLGYISKTDTQPVNYFLHPLMSDLSFTDFVCAETSLEKYQKIICLLEPKAFVTISHPTTMQEIIADYAKQLYLRIAKLNLIGFPVEKELLFCYSSLLQISSIKGNLDEAEYYAKLSYDLTKHNYEQSETPEAAASFCACCSALGNLMLIKGQLKESEAYAKTCCDLMPNFEKITSQPVYIVLFNCYNLLAQLAVRKDDLELFQPYEEKYVELLHLYAGEIETELGGVSSSSFAILGQIEEFTGNAVCAKQLYKQSVDLTYSAQKNAGLVDTKLMSIAAMRDSAFSYDRLGEIAMEEGEEEEAEGYYKQSYEIKKIVFENTQTIIDRLQFLGCCYKLGVIALDEDNLDEAKKYFEESYEQALIIEEQNMLDVILEMYYDICSNLGDIYLDEDNLQESEKYYSKSLKLAKTKVLKVTKEKLEVGYLVDAIDDLIISNYRLSIFVENREKYLLAALELAKNLINKNLDINGRYKFLLEDLIEFYIDKGDTENAKKMQDILDSLSYK